MSETFYHIDRSGNLAVGDVMELSWDLSINEYFTADPAHEQVLHELYPDGLSRHGVRYASAMIGLHNINTQNNSQLLEGAVPVADSSSRPLSLAPLNCIYEWVLEYVRMAEFDDCQSRFQSIFGWSERPEIRNLEPAPNQAPQLVKISCENYARKDMTLTDNCNSYSGGIESARKYWNGNASPDPDWEYLIEPPAEVIEIME